MSITVTTDVFCDGCNNWTNGTSGPRTDTKTARTNAHLEGWKRSRANGNDYCPDCYARLTGRDRK